MPSYPIFYKPITLAGVQGIPYLTRLRMRSFARWAMLDPLEAGVEAHAASRIAFNTTKVPSSYGPEVVGVEVQGGIGVLINARKAVPTILGVDTSKIGPGSSNANQFKLPLNSIGELQFYVDWGDGTTDYIEAWNDAATLHTYAAPGVYTVTLTGSLLGLRFADGNNDKLKVVDILQWGTSVRFLPGPNDFGFGTNSDFRGCDNLTILTDANGPIFEEDGSAIWLFAHCQNFDQDVGGWDVSKLGDFSSMFGACPAFNNGGSPSINNWDTSSAWNISFTFSSAVSFNQPVNDWDVSGVRFLNGTFQSTPLFNQPLDKWDLSNCEQTQLMFRGATSFNQPLGMWNVEKVTRMKGMFDGATAFQQDLGAWWPKSCFEMEEMFKGCTLTPANYDALWTGWTGWTAGAPGAKGLALQNGVLFDGGGSQVTPGSDAEDARAWLIATKGWIITDGDIP
jgi:surface protein